MNDDFGKGKASQFLQRLNRTGRVCSSTAGVRNLFVTAGLIALIFMNYGCQ